MARIRSDKPEAYQSETLAEISLAAERTFKGMATIADDRGRLADKPAQINGELWSMRGGHTKDDLESELDEMVKVDLVCRYTGCDGKRYLHLVKWDQHQKIDRPSKSRLARCPHHQNAPDYCGLHAGECIRPEMSGNLRDASPDSREGASRAREGSRGLQQDETGHHGEPGALASPTGGAAPGTEGDGVPPFTDTSLDQGKRESSRESREGSMQDRGSRTVDRGSRTEGQIHPAEIAGDALGTDPSSPADSEPPGDLQLLIDVPGGKGTSAPRGRRVQPAGDPLFDEWYSAYPLRKARGDAEKAWPKALRECADPQVLIAAARRYAEQRKGHDPKFTKHPATWLNQKCWLDEDAPPPDPQAKPEGSPRPSVGKQVNYPDEEYTSGW